MNDKRRECKHKGKRDIIFKGRSICKHCGKILPKSRKLTKGIKHNIIKKEINFREDNKQTKIG